MNEPPSSPPPPYRVLVLCTHNSARSQIAEGLLRQLGGGRVVAKSAGTEKTRVHPLAIAAMAAAGFTLEGHHSKHLSELAGETFDCVITVCDSAAESCPVFPGAPRRLHWSLPDPSAAEGTDEEKLAAFSGTIAELRARIGPFLAALPATATRTDSA